MRSLIAAIPVFLFSAPALAHSGAVEHSGFLHMALHVLAGIEPWHAALGLGLAVTLWMTARLIRARLS